MPDPQWMDDCDGAAYRAEQGPKLAAAWATWAIGLLPEGARERAAQAWREGKTPGQMDFKFHAAAKRREG